MINSIEDCLYLRRTHSCQWGSSKESPEIALVNSHAIASHPGLDSNLVLSLVALSSMVGYSILLDARERETRLVCDAASLPLD